MPSQLNTLNHRPKNWVGPHNDAGPGPCFDMGVVVQLTWWSFPSLPVRRGLVPGHLVDAKICGLSSPLCKIAWYLHVA